ncbi:MAG: DnaJ domain-containing protein [Myxococcota bacterium]
MSNEQRVPKLAADWSPDGAALTAEEGFLLSRIDGRTPWADLRLIAGLPPQEVDRCLERWLSEGILTVNGAEPKPARAAHGIETGIDLTAEEQRRVLEFEQILDRPYHVVLGVERGADAREIKRAYFALSKEFHPDRYYRREIGSFAPRFERIFRKIIEAYELLSDPATRAEIERAEVPSVAAEARPKAPATGAPAKNESPRRAVLDRLRRQFRIPEKVMAERRFKAKQFYQAATIAARKERWLEAGASIRLAIAFDPWDDAFKQEFLRIQAEVHQVRAAELLSEAEASMDAKAQQGAMRMLEEALCYRPCDPEINHKAAALAFDLGELEAAQEYAQAACDLMPDSAPNHRLLAKTYAKSGLRDKAVAAFERALEIAPDDASLKSELHILKRNRDKSR